MTTSKRKYNFDLPYEISSFYVAMGIGRLKNEGVFDKLPKTLQQSLETAAKHWLPVTITETHCNQIDDETWEQIAERLSLDWDYADSNKKKKAAPKDDRYDSEIS